MTVRRRKASVPVSVLTPSYNYAWAIRDCIESVRSQRDPVEHVIVDDASSDETGMLIEEYEEPIVVLRNETNRGQASTLNRALSHARGEWVCWLPADDLLLPGAVELLDSVSRAYPDVDVVYGDTVFVDRDGSIVRLLPQHPFSERVLRWYGTFLTPGSTFVRRSILDVDAWDASLRQLLDWDLWLRLASEGHRFRYVSWPVSAFRRHPAQLSSNIAESDRAEWRIIRARYGMHDGWLRPLAVATGHLEHAARKLLAGSYWRQWSVRSELRGRSLRWYAEDEGMDTYRHLREMYHRDVERTSWQR